MRETSRHRRAYETYLRLGAGRSIERLHAVLNAEGKAPALRTLYEWSRQVHWQDRIVAFEQRARQAQEEAGADGDSGDARAAGEGGAAVATEGYGVAAGPGGQSGHGGGRHPRDHRRRPAGTPGARRTDRGGRNRCIPSPSG